MIIREHSKTDGAGGILDYLIVNRELDQSRASRVADMTVNNLHVMPAIPKTPGEAREMVRLLTKSLNGFTKNARLNDVRDLKNRLLHIVASFDYARWLLSLALIVVKIIILMGLFSTPYAKGWSCTQDA